MSLIELSWTAKKHPVQNISDLHLANKYMSGKIQKVDGKPTLLQTYFDIHPGLSLDIELVSSSCPAERGGGAVQVRGNTTSAACDL